MDVREIGGSVSHQAGVVLQERENFEFIAMQLYLTKIECFSLSDKDRYHKQAKRLTGIMNSRRLGA